MLPMKEPVSMKENITNVLSQTTNDLIPCHLQVRREPDRPCSRNLFRSVRSILHYYTLPMSCAFLHKTITYFPYLLLTQV